MISPLYAPWPRLTRWSIQGLERQIFPFLVLVGRQNRAKTANDHDCWKSNCCRMIVMCKCCSTAPKWPNNEWSLHFIFVWIQLNQMSKVGMDGFSSWRIIRADIWHFDNYRCLYFYWSIIDKLNTSGLMQLLCLSSVCGLKNISQAETLKTEQETEAVATNQEVGFSHCG